MTIDEFVSKLTPEERILHRDLIEECRERELSAREIGLTIYENIEKLNRISEKILLDLKKIHDLTVDMEKSFDDIRKNLMKDSIELIPDEMFFHE